MVSKVEKTMVSILSVSVSISIFLTFHLCLSLFFVLHLSVSFWEDEEVSFCHHGNSAAYTVAYVVRSQPRDREALSLWTAVWFTFKGLLLPERLW